MDEKANHTNDGDNADQPAAGDIPDELAAILAAETPALSGDFGCDRETFVNFMRHIDRKISVWQRDASAGREFGLQGLRALQLHLAQLSGDFVHTHARALFDEVTRNGRTVPRLNEFLDLAGKAVPGLLPGAAALKEEALRPLARKTGIERRQAAVLGEMLAQRDIGHSLCQAMLRPRPDSRDLLAEFERKGRIDLGKASVERRGNAAILTMHNPDSLNSENEETIAAQEIGVDICVLDRHSQICVLRGGAVSAAPYEGRPVFSSGINLTDLYHGRISYLFYLVRDMGLINKIYRGVLTNGLSPAGQEPDTEEKLWIGVIEDFAIGGGCQAALVMDYVIADDAAYFTLPARKEGIIPGLANLRLPKFIGKRLARQAILNDLRIDADSDEGRMICDDVTSRDNVEAALSNAVDSLTGSGVVSASGNRKALRLGEEPLDLFRRYMSLYAHEQIECHLSPALVDNLEKNWQARRRRRAAS